MLEPLSEMAEKEVMKSENIKSQKTIYRSLGKNSLAWREKDTIAVIEPETTEALKEAKEKYPGKIFYSIRIGYNFVHEHKGGRRRL